MIRYTPLQNYINGFQDFFFLQYCAIYTRKNSTIFRLVYTTQESLDIDIK